MAEREIVSFAGLAGDVIRDFVHPGRAIRLIPTLLLVGLAGAAGVAGGTYLLSLPVLAQPLPVLVCVAPVLGAEAFTARFAERARVGHALAFAIRMCTLAMLWGVPLYVVANRLVGDEPISGGVLAAAAWPQIAAACLLGGAALVGVVVSAAMAAACDTLAEVFMPRRWAWLLAEHRGDLPMFVAAVVGGVALFYLGALPVALGLAWLLVRVSAHAAVACALVGYLSPIAAGAILTARLAGTLARTRDAADALASETGTGIDVLSPPAAIDVRQRPTPAPPAQPAPLRKPLAAAKSVVSPLPTAAATLDTGVPGAEALAFIRAFQALPFKANHDLDGAIHEGEMLAKQQPTSAGVLAELAKLYRRAGRDDDAVTTGGRAITVALNGGMSPVAIEVYRSFAAQRQRLALSAATLTALGKSLRLNGHADDADWCFAEAGEE